MKANELIERLAQAVAEYGDMEVVVEGREVVQVNTVMHVANVRVELLTEEG